MTAIRKIGDNIDLRNIIIHRMNKEAGGHPSYKCAKRALEISSTEQQFIGKVTEAYQKRSSPIYGTFNGEDNDFQELLQKFINSQYDFYSFSTESMKLYNKVIKRVPQATGAFMVFAHYINKANNHEYLLVLAINNNTGYIVQDSLKLSSSKNIDFTKIDRACIINLTKWTECTINPASNSKTYLSFVKGKKDISDYFMKQFIGCDNKQTNEEASVKLLNAITAYCKSKEWDSQKTAAIKNSVFTHCQDRMKNKCEIILSAISSIINPDDPEEFQEFASQEEYGVNPFFSGNKRVLKSLERFKYSDDQIHLEFDNQLLDKSVFYDSRNKTLTFRDLPQDLIDKLEEE